MSVALFYQIEIPNMRDKDIEAISEIAERFHRKHGLVPSYVSSIDMAMITEIDTKRMIHKRRFCSN